MLLLSPVAVKMVARSVYGLGQLYGSFCLSAASERLSSRKQSRVVPYSDCVQLVRIPTGTGGDLWGPAGCVVLFSCVLLPFVLGQYTVITAYPATVGCIESLNLPLMWFL